MTETTLDLDALDALEAQADTADRVTRQAEVEIQRTLGRVIAALESSPLPAALKAAIEPLAQAVIKAGKTAVEVTEATRLIRQVVAQTGEAAAREAEVREQARQADLFRPDPTPDAGPAAEGVANARVVVEAIDQAAEPVLDEEQRKLEEWRLAWKRQVPLPNGAIPSPSCTECGHPTTGHAEWHCSFTGPDGRPCRCSDSGCRGAVPYYDPMTGRFEPPAPPIVDRTPTSEAAPEPLTVVDGRSDAEQAAERRYVEAREAGDPEAADAALEDLRRAETDASEGGAETLESESDPGPPVVFGEVMAVPGPCAHGVPCAAPCVACEGPTAARRPRRRR